MAAGELERGDLEEAFDRTEVRDHDLPFADRAVEDIGADSGVGIGILENAGTGDARALDAGPGKKLAPFTGGLGLRSRSLPL